MLSFASHSECVLESKELKKVLFKESGKQTKESALATLFLVTAPLILDLKFYIH